MSSLRNRTATEGSCTNQEFGHQQVHDLQGARLPRLRIRTRDGAVGRHVECRLGVGQDGEQRQRRALALDREGEEAFVEALDLIEKRSEGILDQPLRRLLE
jgi:hypothetical protein